MEGRTHHDKETEFRRTWKGKSDAWIREIRLARFPDTQASNLEKIIEVIFLQNYIEPKDMEENLLGRNTANLTIFLESIRQELDELPYSFNEIKEEIFEKIVKDIATLNTTAQN